MKTINSYKDYFTEINKCESKEQKEILGEKLNSIMSEYQKKEIIVAEEAKKIVEEKILTLKQSRAKGKVTIEELRRIND